MYSYAMAGSGASEELWSWFAALRELSAAAAALDGAGSGLHGLVAETDWQADGVRALHTLLGELHAQTLDVGAAVREREAQVRSMA